MCQDVETIMHVLNNRVGLIVVLFETETFSGFMKASEVLCGLGWKKYNVWQSVSSSRKLGMFTNDSTTVAVCINCC